jgi:hypothetical protein
VDSQVSLPMSGIVLTLVLMMIALDTRAAHWFAFEPSVARMMT